MHGRLGTVLVTGGAGYVGAVLVPILLEEGYDVRVLDLYLYGEGALSAVRNHPRLVEIRGDIRDGASVCEAVRSCNAVVHLACISNDPSFDLDPALGRSINHEAFGPLLNAAEEAGVARFIFASSSSVYGVKDVPEVSEQMSLEPLTDYARYKATCEEELRRRDAPAFTTVSIRPATVCGYSPRQRLDILTNILTSHAVNRGEIRVIGRNLKRPSLHIRDMAELYAFLLRAPAAAISGRVFNAGFRNYTVGEMAELVRSVVGPSVQIMDVPTDDVRSYHISSRRLTEDLGFVFRHTIEDAIRDLVRAFEEGLLPDALTDPRYVNIQTMKRAGLR